jgi:hypothetical protein
MKDLGIHKVYYSIDNMIVCEKVANMISINSSNILRLVDMTQNGAPTDMIEYYRNIIAKMPHRTKRRNIDNFIRGVRNEIKGCNYDITGNKLIVLIQDNIIGEILIY